MKAYIFLWLLLAASFSVSAQDDTLKVELLKISPEPFHDFLRFDFQINDGQMHEVKIQISNPEQKPIFMEVVYIYPGHESITINTLDFHLKGDYYIKVKVDNRYKFVRKNKWE